MREALGYLERSRIYKALRDAETIPQLQVRLREYAKKYPVLNVVCDAIDDLFERGPRSQRIPGDAVMIGVRKLEEMQTELNKLRRRKAGRRQMEVAGR